MALDMVRYENVLRKQTGNAIPLHRFDGYVNMVNRYGTRKDDTEQYHYQPEPVVDDMLLEMFYESNGLFAKIIDTPAEEAVKHGFTLENVEDEDLIKFYESALDELDWEEVAMTGIKWARLFGGSLAVMLINDGGALEDPLNWRRIRSIDDILVFDRSCITPDVSSMYDYSSSDPFATRGSRLGTPEWYEINNPNGGNFWVHDSRVLAFRNGILPYSTTVQEYRLWGVPEYVRISRAIRNAEIAHESAPKMLSKSVQPVYKMKDLAALLATEEGEDKVLRRLEAIDTARGLLNSITIDSEGEDYSFQSFGFAGVSEVIDSACNWLSALTSIPQTVLFGRSPAGMNATGESDFENYYNFVERIQKRMLRSNLRYLLSVIFTAGRHMGEVRKVPEFNVKFNPLWSMSETEEVQLEASKLQNELTRANIAQTYISNEVLDPKEVRVQLGKPDDLDVEAMLDDMTEEEILESAPQGQQGGAEGMEGMAGMMGGAAPQVGGEQPMEGQGMPTGGDGNSPESAPEATKLPQDQDPDHEDAEGETTDPDELDWITLKNGVHVPLDEKKKAVGGPLEGASFSTSGARPSPKIERKVSSLSAEMRKDYSDKVSELRSKIFEQKDIMAHVNPKVPNYDPSTFINAEKAEKALLKETVELVSQMETGTLIAKGTAVYEKAADGWTVTENDKTFNVKDDRIATEISGYIANSDYPPIEFIASTDEAKQVSDIPPIDSKTAKDWYDCLSTMERKDIVKRAKKDKDFRVLVDNIVAYTEGLYGEQRQIAEKLVRDGLSDASCATIGQETNENLYEFRNLWKGQDLHQSDSSIAKGMADLIGVINESTPTEAKLYRAAHNKEILKTNGTDPYVIPSVGDKIRIDAPTSFTASTAVEKEISGKNIGDIIHYTLEPGASAVDVSKLSRYKQEEFLSCGEYEIVSIDKKQGRLIPIFNGEPTEAQKKRGLEDYYGTPAYHLYEVNITIRQTGKVSFGEKHDSEDSYINCDHHWDERMVTKDEYEDEEIESSCSDDSQDSSGLVKASVETGEDQPPVSDNEESEKWLVKDTEALMSFASNEDVNSSEWLDDEILRRIRSVGVIVTDKNGKILTGTRKDKDHFGEICGPGGHVEPGESLMDAAIRETQEEFGVTPLDLQLIGLGDYEEESGLIPAIFLCTEYEGDMITADFEMENQRFRTIPDILSYNLFGPFKTSIELLLGKLSNVLTNTEESDIIIMDGGPGSGNFGHGGRPGEIGGSSSEESSKPQISAKGVNAATKGYEHKKTRKYKFGKHGADGYAGLTEEQYEQKGIDLLMKPCEGDIDGYSTPEGSIVRFDKSTGDFAKGFPGEYMKTLFNPGYSKGKFKLERALDYFNRKKQEEEVSNGV